MSMRTLLIAAALSPALLLGACGGTKNRGLESVHQPVVSRKDYQFDVATSGNALAPGEAQRLAGWMQSIKVGYGDRVAIDDPNAQAGRGIRDDVQTAAARYGLLVSDDAAVTSGPIAPGTVRVVVSRMTATVPGCPDYSRNGSNEFLGSTTSNHGCATNSNLAAMVASPTDLVRGQPGSYLTDQAQATRAIDAYRRGAGSVSTSGASAGGTTGGGSAGAGSGGGTGGAGAGGGSGGGSSGGQ